MSEPTVFTSVIENFNSNLWGFHVVVPLEQAAPFLQGSDRRVVCTLNDAAEFQCALMPRGDGAFFINVNKKLRDKLKLDLGSSVRISLRKDDSDYGLPMPEEFQELLLIDDEGNQLFHALTPGKQRTLLYIVGNVKSSEKRLNRALAIVDHLKITRGKINFRMLNEALRSRQ